MVEHDIILGLLPEFSFQGIFFAIIIAGLIVIALLIYWVAGKIKEKVDYEGKRVCKMRITIQGSFTIEGNLALNDSFDEEVLEQFESQEDVRVVKGIIDQLKKEDKLFVYNYKVTDDTNADEDFADRTRIISPVQIESPLYSWEDQQSKRPILKFWEAETFRNCVFVHTTKKIRIKNEEGDDEDYWIACPLPKTESKRYVTLYDNPFPNAPVNMFNIIKMESAKGLTQMHSIAKTFSKAVEYNKSLVDERDLYFGLHKELLRKYEEVNIEKNDLEEELAEKPYINIGKEAYKRQQTLGAFWIVLSAVATGFSMLMFPAMFPQDDLQLTMIAGMVVGMIIAGGGFMFYMSRITPIQKVRVEDIE